jgi:hypothetical protein
MHKMISIVFIFIAGCSTEPAYIQQVDKIRNSFTKEIEKTEGWYLSSFGGALMDDIKKIHLKYKAFERVDIAQARRLVVEKVEALLDKINADVIARPYLHNYPFSSDNLEFGILFEDKNTGHFFKPPAIAHARVMAGKMGYSIYNEQLDMFEIIYRESYEEALKIYLETYQKPSLSRKM